MSLDHDEEPLMAEASRSIFRDADCEENLAPSLLTVMRANPVSCGVCLDTCHDKFSSHESDQDENDYFSFRSRNDQECALPTTLGCPSGEETEEGSEEDVDHLMIDFDWTENADYQPSHDINPVLHDNSIQRSDNSCQDHDQIDFSMFFNVPPQPLIKDQPSHITSQRNGPAVHGSFSDIAEARQNKERNLSHSYTHIFTTKGPQSVPEMGSNS